MKGVSNISLAILGLHLCLSSVHAYVWTTDCGVLTTQRMDPIVFPGEEPAGHVHAIVGGSKFGKSAQYTDLQKSQCTTCNVAEDLSNQWVPQLYIKKQSSYMHFAVYYKLINDRGQTIPGTTLYTQGI